MSGDGIDEKTGTLNVYQLLPEQGDSLMVVNCGDHYEIKRHRWTIEPIFLTDEDIAYLKAGTIVWH